MQWLSARVNQSGEHESEQGMTHVMLAAAVRAGDLLLSNGSEEQPQIMLDGGCPDFVNIVNSAVRFFYSLVCKHAWVLRHGSDCPN